MKPSSMLLVLFLTFPHACAESLESQQEVFKKIKRVISLEFHGFDVLTHQLSNGECCDKSDLDTDACYPCKSKINLIIKQSGEADSSQNLFLGNLKDSNFREYVYKSIKVDPTKHLRFDLVHTTRSFNRMYDYWIGPESHFVGMFWMNGVHGINHITKIIVTFDIFLPDPDTKIASFYFYFLKMIWINRKHSDNSCCNAEENVTDCSLACPLNIKTYVGNSEVLWESGRVGYQGKSSKYFLKVGGSSMNTSLFKEDVDFRVELVANESGKLIDVVHVKKINYHPNKDREHHEVKGEYGNVKLQLLLRYDCVGYSGKNCKFDCKANRGMIDCRHDDGTRFCTNGSPDIPHCKEETNNTCHRNGCQNGGYCADLPKTFICYCKKGYMGRFCETPACEYDCYHGECGLDDNVCTCEAGYSGEWCEESKCLKSEKCTYSSKCIRIRDNATCICHKHTTGPFCDKPVCDPECQAGECVFANEANKEEPMVTCKCDEGFEGPACDKIISQPQEYDLVRYVIATKILCIIVFIMVKLLMILIIPLPLKRGTQPLDAD